jgi:hypothetical protein
MDKPRRHGARGGGTVALCIAMLAFAAVPRLWGAGLVSGARAEGHVPPSRQAVIVVRALGYDANLKTRVGDTVNIAVLHKRGHAGSELMAGIMAKAFGALEVTKVEGLPILVSRMAYAGADALKKSLRGGGIDLLFVCEELEGDLAEITGVTRQVKVLTVGSTERLIAEGLSLGVFEVDAKCTILINLPASRLEGVSFTTDLLRLARVIR